MLHPAELQHISSKTIGKEDHVAATLWSPDGQALDALQAMSEWSLGRLKGCSPLGACRQRQHTQTGIQTSDVDVSRLLRRLCCSS